MYIKQLLLVSTNCSCTWFTYLHPVFLIVANSFSTGQTEDDVEAKSEATPEFLDEKKPTLDFPGNKMFFLSWQFSTTIESFRQTTVVDAWIVRLK